MADKGRWTRNQGQQAQIKVMKALESYKLVELCGSFRRKCATVGDLDFVVVPENIADLKRSLEPVIHKILANGNRKMRFLMKNGMQVDFLFVEPKHFGSAVLHSTGSKNFNITCRARAKNKGWKLNEYGLAEMDTGIVLSTDEKDILTALGLSCPPYMRSFK